MPTSSPEHLKTLIRDVPDFPVEGILFRDVTPLLRDPRALGEVVDHFAERYRDAGVQAVAGIESRGFIFGAPLALRLNAGFVPIRKLGKLPADRIRREYALEYGTNVLEMHRDAVRPGERVLVVDDLLATGGTARASVELVEELGAKVIGAAFVIELGFLDGRRELAGHDVFSLLTY